MNIENYRQLLNEQAYLITNIDVYNRLYIQMNVIPGQGSRIFEFLLKGDEGVTEIMEKLETTNIMIGIVGEQERKELHDSALNIINNLTIAQNLGSGLTIAEYNLLVNYIVVTTYRSLKGQMVNRDNYFDDDQLNAEQEKIVEYIHRYPYILTLILMENQATEKKKEG